MDASTFQDPKREAVYDRFVRPTIKPKAKNQSEVIDDIINSIDTKEVKRDKRIDQIFNI